MKKLLVALALCASSMGAWAQTQIEGLTFSTWTDSGYYIGPGFPLGGYVVVARSADVGEYFTSGQYTGIRSEFNLSGQQAATSALLTFSYDARFTVLGATQSTSLPVRLGSYIGDNMAKVSDWRSITVGPTFTSFSLPTAFGQFDTAGLTFGQTLSYDVTSLYNLALSRGDAALGIGLDTFAQFQYAKFGNFTITTVAAVPEPSTYALVLSGLAVLGLARRYRVEQVAEAA